MLKTWLGKARTIATGVWNRFRVFWLPLSGRRKLIFVGCGLLVLLLIGGGIATLKRAIDNRPLSAPLLTPEQGMKKNLEYLLAHPPASSANNVAKASYYNRLMVAQEDAKDYKAAAAAFKKREAANPEGVSYEDYIQLAVYYHAAGDNQSALKALETATQTMPTADNPDQGYYVSVVQQRVDTLSKEYQK